MPNDSLITYLQDHLAGARFAVSLLRDLIEQAEPGIAAVLENVTTEIEADRQVLEGFLGQLGDDASNPKEAAAWLAQKATRLKLALTEPLGRFEALEVLALGVQGKLSLWRALRTLSTQRGSLPEIDYETLIARADQQFDKLEAARIELVPSALN